MKTVQSRTVAVQIYMDNRAEWKTICAGYMGQLRQTENLGRTGYIG